MDKIIKLDKFQSKAVEHTYPKKSVTNLTAGAGAGKSTTLCAVIHNLKEREGFLASKILAITFSKASAIDLLRKYNTLYPADYDVPDFRTIHSFALHQLKGLDKFSDYRITTSIYSYVQKALEGLGYFEVIEPDKQMPFVYKIILGVDVYISNNLSSPLEVGVEDIDMFSEFHEDDLNVVNYTQDEFIEIFLTVLDFMEEDKKLSFDMSLWYYYHEVLKVKGKARNPSLDFRLLAIDEFQDNSKIQFDIVSYLIRNTETGALLTIYDKAQAIYQFRYAKPEYIDAYECGGIVEEVYNMELLYNYRSPKSIVESANLFRVALGLKKSIPTKEDEKGVTGIEIHTAMTNILEANKLIDLIEVQLAKGYSLRDIAIITRNNKVLKEIAEVAIVKKGYDYSLMNDSTGDVLLERGLTNIYYEFSKYLTERLDIHLLNIINILVLSGNEKYKVTELFKNIKYGGRGLGDSYEDKILTNLVRTILIDLPRDYEAVRREGKLKELSSFLHFIKNYVILALDIEELTEDYASMGIDVEDVEFLNVSVLKDTGVIINSLLNLVVNVLDGAKSFDLEEMFNTLIGVIGSYRVDKGLKNALHLGSIHGSKGLEFPIVITLGFMHGRQPTDKLGDFTQKSYVQFTRAKVKLYMIQSINFYPVGDENKIIEDLEPKEGVKLEIVNTYMNNSKKLKYAKQKGFRV